MYRNKKELLYLLNKEGLWVHKELGQNFLLSQTVIQKITQAAQLKATDYVVEVGPGLGILTRQLLKHAGHVRCIELDRGLAEYLKKEFSGHAGFKLEQGNALKAKLPEDSYKLIANIPYNITSPLLRHFLHGENRPELIVLLVQKEVAEKICAREGKHSIMSLQVQVFGNPRIIAGVPRTDFFPVPNIDSAILKIEVYRRPLIKNYRLFSTITRIAFAGRRKTLLNTLKNYRRTDREETLKLLQKAGIDPERRPQTLTLEEWGKLIRVLPNE